MLLVHAPGQAPHVHVTNWALFIFILVTASLLTSSLGLLLGTIMDPRKMQMLFAVILLPATMLGCVYYPWAALQNIRWLQIAILINPMVYMSEGLRAVLTPCSRTCRCGPCCSRWSAARWSSATWAPAPSPSESSTKARAEGATGALRPTMTPGLPCGEYRLTAQCC